MAEKSVKNVLSFKISFAVICYNLNIYGMNKQQVTNTYSCTCSGVVSENDYSPNCNQQVIYERSAWYAVIVLIFPEIWCIFYSFYFVVFKKVEWPSAGQFALLLGMETLSAFGSALMMLIVRNPKFFVEIFKFLYPFTNQTPSQKRLLSLKSVFESH